MLLSNFHSHCNYCDGHAPFEAFVQQALARGFQSYGLSSHAPLPFSTHWAMNKNDIPAYLSEFYSIKEKYRSQIELYVGLEIDYLNDAYNPANTIFQSLPLDFRLGSVHMLEAIDGDLVDIDISPHMFKQLLYERFNGDLRAVVTAYFQKSMSMIDKGGFDILSHPDKIHHNAITCDSSLLDHKWYNCLIRDYFAFIAKADIFLEVNTKAFMQYGLFFPNIKYFKMIVDLHIPIVVNSDAHYPERINDGRIEALQALSAAGVKEAFALSKGQWVPYLIY